MKEREANVVVPPWAQQQAEDVAYSYYSFSLGVLLAEALRPPPTPLGLRPRTIKADLLTKGPMARQVYNELLFGELFGLNF